MIEISKDIHAKEYVLAHAIFKSEAEDICFFFENFADAFRSLPISKRSEFKNELRKGMSKTASEVLREITS